MSVEPAGRRGVKERCCRRAAPCAIGNRQISQAVRDVNDADPLGLEARDDLEEAPDLSLAQRGGRLVHDEDPRVRADGLGDLDQLLLGHAERLDEPIGVDVCADPRQQIAGVAAATPPVDLAPRRARFERERDVLGNGQVRE
jgi:hypothetical protein